jgi:hypothetical protein
MLEEIVALFPETAEAIESQPEDLPTSRLEAFAAYTTKFLGDPDCSQAKKYLQYMSQRHRVGSPKERELIDVYYVEVLFWQAPKSTVEQGWPLVPENLKSLYVGFHGKPPL